MKTGTGFVVKADELHGNFGICLWLGAEAQNQGVCEFKAWMRHIAKSYQ